MQTQLFPQLPERSQLVEHEPFALQRRAFGVLGQAQLVGQGPLDDRPPERSSLQEGCRERGGVGWGRNSLPRLARFQLHGLHQEPANWQILKAPKNHTDQAYPVEAAFVHTIGADTYRPVRAW